MLPEAFLERMQEMLGEEYAAFLESYGREHVQGLRRNQLIDVWHSAGWAQCGGGGM